MCPPGFSVMVFIAGKPAAALDTTTYTAQHQQRPVAQEGELEGCCTPQHPHQAGAEVGQGPGLAQQPLITASLSHPPASPIPALNWGELLVSEVPGRSSSCVQVALTLPLPSPGHQRVLLPPSLCGEEGKSKSRRFEGKKPNKTAKCNIAATGIVKRGLTWAELHG